MGGSWTYTKTWASGQILTAVDLNANFADVKNNFSPTGLDDYSQDITQMRVTTDPYPAGAESLATTFAAELARIRYVIAQITGKTYWYQDPTNEPTIHTKIINIGDWNMQSTAGVNVAHGLTFSKIRSLSVWIEQDDSAFLLYPLNFPVGTDGQIVSGWFYWGDVNVSLNRTAGGVFDAAAFNATSFNRGYITIVYVD
jgi:ABC-type Fe3+-hydroxamate transport system substrate-binding protein